ncbi:hypothetical protein FHU14_001690 [Mesorhizobium sp. RMAD-H1]|nr:hypothetical protein [Mesorhizobium sp. RMAD-H1]
MRKEIALFSNNNIRFLSCRNRMLPRSRDDQRVQKLRVKRMTMVTISSRPASMR